MNNILKANEKWIAGYKGRYTVTTDGQVFSFVSGERRLRKPYNKDGYMLVRLRDGAGGQQWHSVHRLVATTFIDNPENAPCACHINGIPTDNRASNLRWDSHAGNMRDKRGHGTWGIALSEAQAREIKALAIAGRALPWAERRKRGLTQAAIAARFGVGHTLVSLIASGASWSWLDDADAAAA
jgi:hypothetical protein